MSRLVCHEIWSPDTWDTIHIYGHYKGSSTTDVLQKALADLEQTRSLTWDTSYDPFETTPVQVEWSLLLARAWSWLQPAISGSMEYRLLSASFFCTMMRVDELEHPVSAEHNTDGRNPQFRLRVLTRRTRLKSGNLRQFHHRN